MKENRNFFLPLFFFILFIATPAMAYIDPGTGSIIISAIIGITVTTFFYIKDFLTKIKNFFNKKKIIKKNKK